MLKSRATFLTIICALWITGCRSEPQPTRSINPASTPTAVATFSDVGGSGHATGVTPTTTPTAIPTTISQSVAGRTAAFALIPGETVASYSIDQVLLNENGRVVTVTGKTAQVEGVFTLNYDQPLAGQFGLFTANLKLLKSDQPERDDAVRTQWLESDLYPRAAFQPREVRNFPPDARAGEPVRFQLAGDMTIRNVTRQVTWDVTATLKVDRLTGIATTSLRLADFEMPLPTVDGQLAAAEEVTVTLDFAFKRTTEVPLPSPCCGL